MNESVEKGLVRYTYEDLLRIQDLLQKKEAIHIKQVKRLGYQIKAVQQFLAMNRHRDETYSVFIPRDFFVMGEMLETFEATSKKFNWQKVALSIIKHRRELMTTEMVYESARVQFPDELNNRKNGIRNFSSALYYLNLNGKLMRHKEKGSKEYLYGVPELFNIISNTPKTEYLERYKGEL